MEEPGLSLFDLNIEKVLEDWEVYHAIREIMANAMDEQLPTQTKEIEIFQDRQGKWHIRDFGRGLEYQHLTQNENEEKLANPNLDRSMPDCLIVQVLSEEAFSGFVQGDFSAFTRAK